MVGLPSKKNALAFTVILILTFSSLAVAQESKRSQGQTSIRPPSLFPLKEEKGLTEVQKQARAYRQQGFELQGMGDIEGALVLYQKAVELDPVYAAVYNDLGVIYETKGLADRAEASYLKAISIAPDFLGAYSNLALFYENKRDLKSATIYWNKRLELGAPGDPWTEKARQRLDDIDLVLGQKGDRSKERETEILELMDEVAARRALTQKDDKSLAELYFDRAKVSFDRKDYLISLKQALDAQQLDPTSKAVNEFIVRLQKRILSR